MNTWIKFVKDYHAKHPELSYKEALQQCSKINKQKNVDGGNILKSATKTLNKTVKSVSNVGKSVSNVGKRIIDYKNHHAPPIVLRYLKLYGNQRVVKFQLYKHRLQQYIMNALSIMSDNQPFDKLHHLRIYLYLENGKCIFIEKNERLNMGEGMEKDNSELLMIDDGDMPDNLTVNEIYENTKQLQGDKFFNYSSSSNNCQYFVRDLLIANHINNIDKYIGFIKENTEQIFKNNGGMRKFANTLTDIAGIGSVITNGGNLNNKSKDTLGKFRKDLKIHMNNDFEEEEKTNKYLKEIKDIDEQIFKLLKSRQ